MLSLHCIKPPVCRRLVDKQSFYLFLNESGKALARNCGDAYQFRLQNTKLESFKINFEVKTGV